MMDVDAETNWLRIAPKLRRALGFAPLTTEEAKKGMADAACFPMTDEEIARIVEYATGTPLTTPHPF